MRPPVRRGFLVLALLLACCAAPPEPTIPRQAVGDPLAARLERTVRKLSTLRSDWAEGQSHEGERNVWQVDQLRAAAGWIEGEFCALGYGVRRECYTVTASGKEETVWNIIAERRGRARPEELLVVGAHYDTRVAMPTPRSHGPPRPWLTGTPGANDNASGVAVLLALAREFASRSQERTVRFVAFTCEEPPFFQTDEMGSVMHARGCKLRGEKVEGMISLETLGYYTELPDTQRYPFPNASGLPTVGDFVGFVTTTGSWRFTQLAAEAYPFHTAGKAEPRVLAISFFPVVRQIAWSDDWSFTREGFPAFAVTDTAHQRYVCYHRACDTAEKLSYGKMAHLTRGLVKVVEDLANRRE